MRHIYVTFAAVRCVLAARSVSCKFLAVTAVPVQCYCSTFYEGNDLAWMMAAVENWCPCCLCVDEEQGLKRFLSGVRVVVIIDASPRARKVGWSEQWVWKYVEVRLSPE